MKMMMMMMMTRTMVAARMTIGSGSGYINGNEDIVIKINSLSRITIDPKQSGQVLQGYPHLVLLFYCQPDQNGKLALMQRQ